MFCTYTLSEPIGLHLTRASWCACCCANDARLPEPVGAPAAVQMMPGCSCRAQAAVRRRFVQPGLATPSLHCTMPDCCNLSDNLSDAAAGNLSDARQARAQCTQVAGVRAPNRQPTVHAARPVLWRMLPPKRQQIQRSRGGVQARWPHAHAQPGVHTHGLHGPALRGRTTAATQLGGERAGSSGSSSCSSLDASCACGW